MFTNKYSFIFGQKSNIYWFIGIWIQCRWIIVSCPNPRTLACQRLAKDKHSSLLQKFVNYSRKKFRRNSSRSRLKWGWSINLPQIKRNVFFLARKKAHYLKSFKIHLRERFKRSDFALLRVFKLWTVYLCAIK